VANTSPRIWLQLRAQAFPRVNGGWNGATAAPNGWSIAPPEIVRDFSISELGTTGSAGPLAIPKMVAHPRGFNASKFLVKVVLPTPSIT
jgi:hypothetical protein